MCCDALKGFITTMADNTFGTDFRNSYDTGSVSYARGVNNAHKTSLIGGSFLTAKGIFDAGAGGAGMAGSVTLEVSSGGVASVVAGPGFVASAGLTTVGGLEVLGGSALVSNTKDNMSADGDTFNRSDNSSSSNTSSGSGGRRSKNRIPDKGEPNTTATNNSGTTTKKYGSDGNIQKEFNKGHGNNAPINEQSNHIHDYKPNPQNPTGRGERMNGRPPKKGELIRDFGIPNNGNN